MNRFLPAALVFALLVAGPLISGRLVPPIVGIGTFLAGGALGLLFGVAFIAAGIIALLRRREGATRTLVAGALPLLATLVVVGLFVLRPGPANRFNDVTTDLADPPMMIEGPAAGAAYPDAFRAMHMADYPGLQTQRFAATPDQVFDAALAVAQTMEDWQLLHQNRAGGIIQAVARTSIFRFEDDVVIRIRPDGTGSIVDIRSKSRIGQGDRGANAHRIRTYQAALAARLKTSS